MDCVRYLEANALYSVLGKDRAFLEQRVLFILNSISKICKGISGFDIQTQNHRLHLVETSQKCYKLKIKIGLS